MDNQLDLWGNIEATSASADSVLTLIKSQADLLEKKTNGKIKADFCLVQYEYKTKQTYLSATRSLMESIGHLVGPLTEPEVEVVEVDERKNLKNASCFYKRGKYKFEIYNESYKFRVFLLDFQSVFPVKFEVEYGILEDKKTSNSVKSIDDATSLLRSILTSSKVRFIIKQMMDLDG